MNKAAHKYLPIALGLMAVLLLVLSVRLPLWHMRMEAPQYREDEALRVTVYPGALRGDLREIVVLNQYIGVHIPEVLPQNGWLPTALFSAAAAGLIVSLMPGLIRRAGLALVALGLAGALGFAVFQARQQMHDIGHKRDAHTKLARVHDFDPPFLGTAKIAQFTVKSSLGTGAFLIGAAISLQLLAVVFGARSSRPQKHDRFAGSCNGDDTLKGGKMCARDGRTQLLCNPAAH